MGFTLPVQCGGEKQVCFVSAFLSAQTLLQCRRQSKAFQLMPFPGGQRCFPKAFIYTFAALVFCSGELRRSAQQSFSSWLVSEIHLIRVTIGEQVMGISPMLIAQEKRQGGRGHVWEWNTLPALPAWLHPSSLSSDTWNRQSLFLVISRPFEIWSFAPWHGTGL